MQECSKRESRCQDLQVQGVALQAASDKAAAAQVAADSAGRRAQEASTAATWEVKKRQELVEAHDAKLLAMQQELFKVGVVSRILYPQRVCIYAVCLYLRVCVRMAQATHAAHATHHANGMLL